MEPLTLEARHLTVATVAESDLPDLLPLYATNPEYVTLVQGPGGYSLEELQRDWHLVGLTGRTMLVIRRTADHTVVDTAEFLAEHPDDGSAWLGLLLIHGDLRGRGYGSEALATLLEHFQRDRGWSCVRVAVPQLNERLRHFWERHGFTPFETVRRRLPGGETALVCLERQLAEARNTQPS